MEYYGRAVDAYLNAERWESAAAMCRKILRSQPTSVRARCTLSWLAIGKGFVADAQTQIMDYAEAAYLFGRESLAAFATQAHLGWTQLMQGRLADSAKTLREALSGGPFHQVGLQFDALPDEKRAALRAFLTRLLHD